MKYLSLPIILSIEHPSTWWSVIQLATVVIITVALFIQQTKETSK